MARVLGLRTVDCNRRSWGGFQWPAAGKVVAQDWEPTCECGHGLHALIGGIGDGSLLSWDESAIWQAVWIDEDKIVDLGGKVKFPECEIACEGTRAEVIQFMIDNGADATKMNAGIVVGDESAVASGRFGFARATGEHGHAVADGRQGTAVATGKYGRATAAGLQGHATATGEFGEAVAGCCGMAFSHYAARVGGWGVIRIKCGDREFIGYAGYDIKRGVLYKVKNGKFVHAKSLFRRIYEACFGSKNG